MPFLMLENVRSGVNELAVRCSTSIKAFRFAGNGAFCRRAHGKQFCDKANGVIMYAKEVVEQIGEGLEEDGSVPFFDADMLPDGLAELYMRRYKEAFRGRELMQEYERYSSPMLSVL